MMRSVDPRRIIASPHQRNQTSVSCGEVSCGGITPMTVKFLIVQNNRLPDRFR